MILNVSNSSSDLNKANISINGAKNALLPLLFSCPLMTGKVKLHNAPVDIFDYKRSKKILRSIGFDIMEHENSISVCNANKSKHVDINNALTSQTRCSIYLLGSLAKSAHSLKIGYPGGCSFGETRNFDIHLNGLKALNAKITVENDTLTLKHVKDIDAEYYLPFPSVGATTNLILYSVIGHCSIHLKNCAIEPEIINVIDFLNQCGAKVSYDIGKREIYIKGVSILNATEFNIIYDRIQVMTYICLAIMHQIDISISGVSNLDIINVPISILGNSGVKFTYDNTLNTITVLGNQCDKIKGMRIITDPYPYFPTDLQPIFASLALTAKSSTTIIERVIPERTKYINELQKFNANISHIDNIININPSNKLINAIATSTDLRGGMACLMTASITAGTSQINNADQICRGYDNLLLNSKKFMQVSTTNSNIQAYDENRIKL
ncbi:MAG: UDP-N-acetylglucosamine 1-carboxyvinyltransferase [Francisellaceae bacterium]|jgi:UDP-N-acetylglucosamine 1-carboxyvinyltransferase